MYREIYWGEDMIRKGDILTYYWPHHWGMFGIHVTYDISEFADMRGSKYYKHDMDVAYIHETVWRYMTARNPNIGKKFTHLRDDKDGMPHRLVMNRHFSRPLPLP